MVDSAYIVDFTRRLEVLGRQDRRLKSFPVSGRGELGFAGVDRADERRKVLPRIDPVQLARLDDREQARRGLGPTHGVRAVPCFATDDGISEQSFLRVVVDRALRVSNEARERIEVVQEVSERHCHLAFSRKGPDRC